MLALDEIRKPRFVWGVVGSRPSYSDRINVQQRHRESTVVLFGWLSWVHACDGACIVLTTTFCQSYNMCVLSPTGVTVPMLHIWPS